MRNLKVEESEKVKEVIRKEVKDWDDELVCRARFKAFSGQRSDWEPIYLFWRNLILTVARQLGLFIIKPSHLKTHWFNRGGLSPLCLDDVLFVMYNEGEAVPAADVADPTAGRISRIFRRVTSSVASFASSAPTPQVLMAHDRLILTPILKDKAVEIVEVLSECHWNGWCIVTMERFWELCGGTFEGSVVLSHLSAQGKARYLSLPNRGDLLQGVKVSISASSVPSVSSLDRDVLHLTWTRERLQQQLDVIDRRCETLRKSALACLHSENKKVALRHARELKLANESREKCSTFMNRVVEVLDFIANAEMTKKVSEAIQIGAKAIKENKISVEEVEDSLQEIEESIDTLKQLENIIESTPLYSVTDDEENIEEEFRKLELDIGHENHHEPIVKTEVNNAVETESSAEVLLDSLSNLKLSDDGQARIPAIQGTASTVRNNKTKTPDLATA
ncbi:hypothetical protein ACLB2K_002119 [Fragaria x ananassa]